MFTYTAITGRIVRFALGDEDRYRSPIWRLWVGGDEVYIGMRTPVGIAKISLHSSGLWMFNQGHSRISIRGPRRLSEEITLGPLIQFPGNYPKRRLPLFERGTVKSIFLYKQPDIGYWRNFLALFGNKILDGVSLFDQFSDEFELIGPIPRRTLTSVWLGTFAAPMDAESIDLLRDQRTKTQVTVAGGTEVTYAPWMLRLDSLSPNQTSVISLELGEENLRIE